MANGCNFLCFSLNKCRPAQKALYNTCLNRQYDGFRKLIDQVRNYYIPYNEISMYVTFKQTLYAM